MRKRLNTQTGADPNTPTKCRCGDTQTRSATQAPHRQIPTTAYSGRDTLNERQTKKPPQCSTACRGNLPRQTKCGRARQPKTMYPNKQSARRQRELVPRHAIENEDMRKHANKATKQHKKTTHLRLQESPQDTSVAQGNSQTTTHSTRHTGGNQPP